MQAFMLAKYFSAVEMSKSAALVQQAILSKTNIYSMKAQVSNLALQTITGLCLRTVQYATAELHERDLVRKQAIKRTATYNDLNVYTVMVPWRCDPRAVDAALPWYAQRNRYRTAQMGKHAKTVHPNPIGERREPPPAVSEAEATRWHTPGTLPWYWAQGLEPPREGEQSP